MNDEVTTVSSSRSDALQDDPAIDVERFWSTAQSLDEIGLPPNPETTPALKRLGPPPFVRSRFPLMGFLATVYEHITTHVRDHPEEDRFGE
ncbi:MAG: hypothetical protein MI923_08700 [Phycisphaerales bacterium]|nr:hypothetical protein [Phycisphaerales bacterium]